MTIFNSQDETLPVGLSVQRILSTRRRIHGANLNNYLQERICICISVWICKKVPPGFFSNCFIFSIGHFSLLLSVQKPLKGQCPDCAHTRASSGLFFKRQQNYVILTRRDFLPDRTVDGDLFFTFASDFLDFRRSFSSYLKFGSRHEDSSRFCHQQGRHATRKSRSARFKNSFSNVKLVSEVKCSKSSSICLICLRSSLKRLTERYK